MRASVNTTAGTRPTLTSMSRRLFSCTNGSRAMVLSTSSTCRNVSVTIFSQLAKAQGDQFAHSSFVVGIHSSTRWCAEANRQSLSRLDQLVHDHLEQRSVELADVLVSPSAYLLDNTAGGVGETTPIIRAAVCGSGDPPSRAEEGTTSPRELVYSSDRNSKGAELFCDAIDDLASVAPETDLAVTFLGKSGIIGTQTGESYVRNRGRHWPWPLTILSASNREEAIHYLRSGTASQ